MSKDLRAIVVGGGHLGYHMAELLDKRGHEVVIIEQDRHRCEYLTDQYCATVIEGDGTRPSVLRQAQPGRSDVIASMIGDRTGTNIGVCMTAERIAPDIRTVARIDHGDDEEYAELVDAVVYPEELAAHAGVNKVMDVTGSGLRTIEEVTRNLELIEITVAENAPAAGKQFRDVGFPTGSLVICSREAQSFATGETIAEPGSTFVMAVNPEIADEVVRLMRG